MSWSTTAIANGHAVASLCVAKSRTKAEIEQMLGLSPSQAREALDWARAERLVMRSPFHCIYENGAWRYGYRHRVVEVIDRTIWNYKYIGTRTSNQALDLEHTLLTKGPLSSTITAKQRNVFKRQLTMMQGNSATFDLMVQELSGLTP